MRKLALLLSLLAFGALGLVACNDDQTTVASETQPADDGNGHAESPAESGGDTQLGNRETIERNGNDWATLFAAEGFKPGLWRYMGQPAGERMGCERAATGKIKNCTPPSDEYRQSFANATVERVVIHGHRATVEFSNGESVEWEGNLTDQGDPAGGHLVWFVPATWFKEIARRNYEP